MEIAGRKDKRRRHAEMRRIPWPNRSLRLSDARTWASPPFSTRWSGKRIAIVEDTPGVTRDRVYADCEWQNYKFTLIDTGGIDPTSDDPLLSQMRRQAEIAIETCDVILFFVDGRAGLTADDENVADMLRKSGKPVMLVVNKVDNVRMMDDVYEFYNLGHGRPHRRLLGEPAQLRRPARSAVREVPRAGRGRGARTARFRSP